MNKLLILISIFAINISLFSIVFEIENENDIKILDVQTHCDNTNEYHLIDPYLLIKLQTRTTSIDQAIIHVNSIDKCNETYLNLREVME